MCQYGELNATKQSPLVTHASLPAENATAIRQPWKQLQTFGWVDLYLLSFLALRVNVARSTSFNVEPRPNCPDSLEMKCGKSSYSKRLFTNAPSDMQSSR